MRDWVRKWLGVPQLEKQLEEMEELVSTIARNIRDLEATINSFSKEDRQYLTKKDRADILSEVWKVESKFDKELAEIEERLRTLEEDYLQFKEHVVAELEGLKAKKSRRGRKKSSE